MSNSAENDSRIGNVTTSAHPKCVICRSRSTHIINYNTLHNGIRTPVHECRDCSHKFCHPLPSKNEVLSWYQGMHYFEANVGHQGISDIKLSSQWDGFINTRIKAFETHVVPFLSKKQATIIEIGCLEEMLLKELSRRGYTAIGLEANAAVALYSRAVNGVDIRVCNIEDKGAILQADAILSFHTFEHLRDPRSATAEAFQMLHPGGVLLLEIPCDDDEMNNPDHFHFFNEPSLRKMMSSFFPKVKIVPNSYKRNGLYEIGSLYAIGIKS